MYVNESGNQKKTKYTCKMIMIILPSRALQILIERSFFCFIPILPRAARRQNFYYDIVKL